MSGQEKSRTLLEMLWDELISKLDALLADGEPEPSLPDSWCGDDMDNYAEWGRQQGRCEGLAYAIAVITNPYRPDVPAIKAEAMRRWEEDPLQHGKGFKRSAPE